MSVLLIQECNTDMRSISITNLNPSVNSVFNHSLFRPVKPASQSTSKDLLFDDIVDINIQEKGKNFRRVIFIVSKLYGFIQLYRSRTCTQSWTGRGPSVPLESLAWWQQPWSLCTASSTRCTGQVFSVHLQKHFIITKCPLLIVYSPSPT